VIDRRRGFSLDFGPAAFHSSGFLILRMKSSFIFCRKFRVSLLALGACVTFAAPVAGQERTDGAPESFRNESPSIPKVVTNDYFGVSRPPAPATEKKVSAAPAPTSASGEVKPVAPPPAKNAAAPPKPAPEILPQYEITAKQDENGNWVLVSRRLPDAPAAPEAEAAAPSFASLKISTGNAELDQTIQEMSAKYGVDPRLVVEVIRQESGFRQYAVSSAGAKGLMQLIPATAARMGTKDIFDMRQNVEGGVKYLRMLLDMFDGNVHLALAGYNAGEGRVIRSGRQIPAIPETQNYVRSIMARYRRTGASPAAGQASTKPSAAPEPKPAPEKPAAAAPAAPLRVEQRDGVPLLTNH
jgi:soluble lytic murein transglycosylase-like protein